MGKRIYVDTEEGMSQYEEYDFNETNIVDAIYVHARMEIDRGDPYIEALPNPRDARDIMRDYTRQLPLYDFNKVRSMSKLDKMLAVGTLRTLRFPLPFHKDLEFNMYNALITSYRARHQMNTGNRSVEITVNGEPMEADYILSGNSSDATNAGFSLIGYSGCGKSSAISELVHYYPQVIMHTNADNSYFAQITYLVVNCVANSNFAALYEGIGDAIDKALGNAEPVYAKEIRKTKGLGNKAEKVKTFVEKLGIGIIIFDEIQLIDFSHTKENTFDSLLTLANRTKVAIAVVGTEDAREKMFKELRTSRRLGMMINGNLYCESREYFGFLVKNLFRYQWFDELIEVTDDITNALFDVSKGIVDQLISIYSCMHYDYLSKNKRPQIDGEYVRKIAKKFYPNIQDTLAHLESTENSQMLQNVRENANNMIDELIDKAKQEQAMKTITETDTSQETIQLSNVVANIMAVYDEYSIRQIEDAFNKVMGRKANVGKSEREISREVLKRLQKAPVRKNKKSKLESPDIGHMQSFLGIEEEEKNEIHSLNYKTIS